MSKRSDKKRLAAERAAAAAELGRLSQELRCAYGRFDCITDPDMTDACIYEINSLKARCDHILKTIKSLS